MPDAPSQARVVVVGAGIVGCSAAYHLTRLGWRDVVVVDQGPLFVTGGSTSHAPGLVFQNNSSRVQAELARDSVELYSSLGAGGAPLYRRVGGIELAATPERWEELKRRLGHARSWGIPAELIGPEEIQRLVPIIRADRLHGAIHVPGDGVADGVGLSRALAREASARGAEFHGNVRVDGFEVERGHIRAVRTSGGLIETENVLICAGIWGPLLGRMAGVPIPLTPVQHLYAKTAPLPELAGETREISHPIVRHQDRSMYFRQVGTQYGIGAYRHEPLLVDPADIRPPPWPSPARGQGTLMPSLMPFQAEHFAPSHAWAIEIFPSFRDMPLVDVISGMFSFTPDAQSLLGESLDVRGFWVAEAIWVTHAGGAGRVIAEWMVDGTPSLDLHEVDLNRFYSHAWSPPYVRARGAQQYREVYDVVHPLQQMDRPRGLRRQPFHRRLEELGAVCFESAGWERPQWYEANRGLLDEQPAPRREGWASRHWSPIQAVEHRAARERVAMFDLSPFTKVEVSGPGALAFLQRLAANQVDQPLGRVTYTAMLNERGGIECDLTVTRFAEDRFWVVTGGAVGMHDLAWLRRNLPGDGSVHLANLTSSYCCVGVWGPRARDLVQSVSEDDLCNAGFPYLTARQVFVDTVPVVAIRISYVGELGWELYAPSEYGLHLWDVLWEAGRPLDVVAAGGGAFDSLRLEKGYRLWGADISPEHNPYEAGLGFAVRLNKGEFLGRSALQRAREEGSHRSLSCMVLDDSSMVVMGKEPILDGDQVLGYVTSANTGYSVGQSIVYGYLPVEHAVEGARVEVQYFGRRYPASVVREPLYDAEMARLKEPAAASVSAQ